MTGHASATFLNRMKRSLRGSGGQISRGSQVLTMPRKALQRKVSGDSPVFVNRKREGEACPAIPVGQLIRERI
jgi:hypothetical protein